MRGHQQVIDLRRKGKKPSCVFLTVGDLPAGWEVNGEIRDGSAPQVWTGADDPMFADLRWLVGLRVVIDQQGYQSETYWSWFDAVKVVKPATLVAFEPDGEVVVWQA